MGYEFRAGQIVDSITLWTNKRGLGCFGGTGGKVKDKRIAQPGETLGDIQIESKVFKNYTIVSNLVNPVWVPAADRDSWTDGIW